MATTETKAPEQVNWAEMKPQLIRLLLELGPLVVFFTVNALGERLLEGNETLSGWFSSPIILATAVFMVAMTISLLLSWFLLRSAVKIARRFSRPTRSSTSRFLQPCSSSRNSRLISARLGDFASRDGTAA